MLFVVFLHGSNTEIMNIVLGKMHRKLQKFDAATLIISLFLLINLFLTASAQSTANNYNEQMKEAKARLLEAIQKGK